ncbi:Cupin domain protein [Cribrihabitans marinus]|uniref:Cupin domain protein n=1 Tax=Cribrihabitans marinus TaxID=1227549 RepID=A0A1H6X9Z3_9RHOB|nr:cupin domain-containing protein [Cribrihabitans marinus]GGH27062.1 cupin [Cribrihabitans marinus]SEJ25959.1 Cupin domain protein [Cribrihabitans marinus]
MQIHPAGSRPTRRANPDYFTGTVWQDPVIEAPEPARVRALVVRFEPGARTAWHTHPLGQTLMVLSGVGLVGRRGEAPRLIRAGDTVWIPPGEQHWHGATPDIAMTHLAMQEAEDGRVADWQEKVSDADYLAAAS